MKKANRILAALMLVVLALSFTGCSSENGYEQVVNKYCRALQKNDFNALNSIIDWDNIQKIIDLGKGNNVIDIKDAKEKIKEKFTDIYDEYKYQYDDGFTVTHGNITVLKSNNYEVFALKSIQRFAKLKNEAEDADATKFINDFVANLKYVTVVKTNITVKSKKDSSEKDKEEETFYTYCYKGKWYRNTSVLDYVVRALNTRERLAGTDDSGDDGWG